MSVQAGMDVQPGIIPNKDAETTAAVMLGTTSRALGTMTSPQWPEPSIPGARAEVAKKIRNGVNGVNGFHLPKDEPQKEEAEEEVDYLKMILNARVYDVAIETPLTYATKVS